MKNLIFTDQKIILLCGLIFCYYFVVKKILTILSKYLVARFPIVRNATVKEQEGVMSLLLFSVSHVLFVVLMMQLYSVDFRQVFGSNISWQLLLIAPLLGIGLMAVSTQICQVMIVVCESIGVGPTGLKGWLLLSQSGWLSKHLYTLKVLPLILSLPMIVLQISSEELMFRTVIFDVLKPFSDCFVIGFSTALFVIVQTFSMPNKLSAMFSMIGALVMGIVHGVLYANTAAILPLIVSHLVFFLFAVK